MPNTSPSRPRVGLFVSCLVDLYRPQIGFAALELLERAGCEVAVPQQQTCCGQPAYNSGDDASAAELARSTIDAMESFDYIVVPSGSCASMLKVHYPELLSADPVWSSRAQQFASKVHELLAFLVDVCEFTEIEAEFEGVVTYHDSCSGLRELGISAQPRQLLASVKKLRLAEMESSDVCCGFGGTFCVKYPEISTRMVSDKVSLAEQSGADTVLGGDLGCLLNIQGRISRLGRPLRVLHTAEVLAGMVSGDDPGIGNLSPAAACGRTDVEARDSTSAHDSASASTQNRGQL